MPDTRPDPDALLARLKAEETGPAKGKVNGLEKMLPEYYQLRGWDAQGVPTPGKLAELSLA